MAVLTVIPLIGTLGILFIGFNVIIITIILSYDNYIKYSNSNGFLKAIV